MPVKEEIISRLPVTITLAVGAAIDRGSLMGIPIGIISAIKRGSVWSTGRRWCSRSSGCRRRCSGSAYLFLYIFWFKLVAAGDRRSRSARSVIQAVFSGVFILPWLVLSLTFAAFYARMVRGNLIETMGEDYIRTARAKGLSEKRGDLQARPARALTPVVTMFGLDLATLLGGAFITETVFNLPGIGQYRGARASSTTTSRRYGRHAVRRRSSSCSRTSCVDIAYAFLDPRVRYT